MDPAEMQGIPLRRSSEAGAAARCRNFWRLPKFQIFPFLHRKKKICFFIKLFRMFCCLFFNKKLLRFFKAQNFANLIFVNNSSENYQHSPLTQLNYFHQLNLARWLDVLVDLMVSEVGSSYWIHFLEIAFLRVLQSHCNSIYVAPLCHCYWQAAPTDNTIHSSHKCF